jgi:hypothetical protein
MLSPCRARQAAEHFVEFAALAVHAVHFPSLAIDQIDHRGGELRTVRRIARIDAEDVIDALDFAERGEFLGRCAVGLQRHRAFQP